MHMMTDNVIFVSAAMSQNKMLIWFLRNELHIPYMQQQN